MSCFLSLPLFHSPSVFLYLSLFLSLSYSHSKSLFFCQPLLLFFFQAPPLSPDYSPPLCSIIQAAMEPLPNNRPTTDYLLNLPQSINAKNTPDYILSDACSNVIATRFSRSASFNPSMIHPSGMGLGLGVNMGMGMRNLIGSKRGKEGLFGVNELHNPHGYLSDDDRDVRAGTPTGTYYLF